MDVDTLAPGEDFFKTVEDRLGSCDALVAIIGRAWVAQTDSLKNAKDFIRVEIAAALSRGVLVLPVLVEGVEMPAAESLPDDLLPLTQRQALPIVDAYFEEGMGRLVGALEKARAAANR
jgi:hypothetical protein